MNIDDIDVKAKKYDREKQFVILNILVYGILEVRGFRARFGTTRRSSGSSVWIVSPPAVRVGKNYFWVFEMKDLELWKELEKKIIYAAQEYTDRSM